MVGKILLPKLTTALTHPGSPEAGAVNMLGMVMKS